MLRGGTGSIYSDLYSEANRKVSKVIVFSTLELVRSIT